MTMFSWVSCDGLADAGCYITSADPPWPAMVNIEAEPCTVLAEDARALAGVLIAAADAADAENEKAFA